MVDRGVAVKTLEGAPCSVGFAQAPIVVDGKEVEVGAAGCALNVAGKNCWWPMPGSAVECLIWLGVLEVQ